MSHRTDQVASVIKRAVQKVLAQGLSDPRLAPIITVTDVKVTRDLKEASVFVTMLPEDAKDLTMHGLRSAAKHVRHVISDQIALPKAPILHFKHDTGAQNQAGVLRALSELRDDTPTQDHAHTVAPDSEEGDAEAQH